MLTIFEVSSPSARRQLFSKFKATEQTWVVSDLRSKLELTRELVDQNGFVAGDAVVRASELWRKYLLMARPELQVSSREYILTWLAQELAEREQQWLRSPGAAQTCYEFITQLMPLLAHHNGLEALREYFTTYPDAFLRWGGWAELSYELWQKLSSLGLITPAWITGCLSNEPVLKDILKKPITFDLGPELTSLEADLILRLSAHQEVAVLQPTPIWAKEYSKTMEPYRWLREQGAVQPKVITIPHDLSPKKILRRRMTSALAEVKQAVATTRKWLEAGVPAERISIVAPDLEIYWPALNQHLLEEGIPVQRPVQIRAQSIPALVQWFAHLRLRSLDVKSHDLQISLFRESTQALSFDRFQVLFERLYTREDLGRLPEIAKLYSEDLNTDRRLSRDEFITWALRQLPEEANLEHVESVLRPLFADSRDGISFQLQRWVHFLLQVSAKIELARTPPQRTGVVCVSVGNADGLRHDKLILLGLTESQLRKSGRAGLLATDVTRWRQDHGFQLAHPEQAHLEFLARWMADGDASEQLWLTCESDFSGEVQVPAWFWLKTAEVAERFTQVPDPTRLDEIQRLSFQALAQERAWPAERSQMLEMAIAQDLGQKPLPPFPVLTERRLSASSVESYLKCPFTYAAKQLFRLTDLSHLDIDIDAQRRGSFVHRILQELTIEPFRAEWSNQELYDLLDQLRERENFEIGEPRLWPALRARLSELSKRFLLFENEWRKEFIETKTCGRELEFKAAWSSQKKSFTQSGEGDWTFRGRIDRVDRDNSGKHLVIDYKYTKGDLSQVGSWLKKNQLQLLFYSMAVEEGWTELGPQEVVGAVYFAVSSLDRKTGFRLEDEKQRLYALDDKGKNKISSDAKQELYISLTEVVGKVVDGLTAGEFAPKPKDPKDCPECHWRNLCRSPHLN